MTSHADLKRLATEANQDEWTAATMEQCTGTQPQPWGQVINLPRVYVDRCQFFTPEDARYIAAVRPTKVLALLERIARLEKIEDAAKEFRTAYAINRDVGGGRGYELVIQREIELITALASAEQEKNG